MRYYDRHSQAYLTTTLFLPECQYRVALPGEDDKFVCRNQRVHSRGHVVNDVICSLCVERDKPGEPRELFSIVVAAPAGAPPSEPEVKEGPGTELHKRLARFGIHAKPNCPCLARMKEMNRQGPQWCRENINLIVGWLQEEAATRHLPCPAMVAKKLILSAIKSAERAAIGS